MANRFEEPTEEERREQVAILKAFQSRDSLVEGTVTGYMGKFSTFWKFREGTRNERGGDRDLFLLSTPPSQRRQVWLDFIGFLVDIQHIRGQSCFEHLSAVKRVLSRNGLTDLEFADDSATEVKDAKKKAKYSNDELQDRAEAASKRLKLPMFDELEDLLYKELWLDTEEEVHYVKAYKRGVWLGIALMTMTGARPSNIIVTAGSEHTIRAKNVRLMLFKEGDPESETYISGGDPWPDGYTVNDGGGGRSRLSQPENRTEVRTQGHPSCGYSLYPFH